MAKWGGLGSITSALPSDLRNFLQRVRETLDLAMAGANRFVTVNDLVSGNVAATDARGNVIALDSALYDATPPPAPTGLVTAGALTTIMLQWDTPGYGNHAHTEIWRAATDNLGVAALIGTASGVLYADSVDAGSSYFYWARFVSRASIEGAYNATAGVNGTTSQDPTELLAILTDQITSSQLHATLGSRINLIDAVNTGLVTQVGTASQSIDDMAAALIQSTLDKADLLDRLARERAISDATVTIDPLTGSVTLLAEAAITTDVEARITTVETSVNAAAGTANTAISRLDVIGTVDEFGNPQNGVLNAMNTAINANTDGIALKADSAYIDSAVLAINANVETAVLSPVALMRLFLAGGNAIPIMQAAHIRVANAEQTLTTHTDQLVAEAQARLTLAALVDQNIAAILSEQTARADADSALASDITQVQARLDTGDYAAVKEESSASASAVAGLSAEYSLKLDVNGYVSGYGTVNDGTSSEFLIATDKFGIVAPTLNSDTEPATKYHGLIWKNTSASTVAGVLAGESRRWVVVGGAGSWQPVGFGAMPFAVLTTAATINGVAFQPGVYIDGASIVEASIGTAQIGNAAVDSASIANGAIHDIHVNDLAASKITTGTLQASQQISVGDSVVINGAGHIRTFGAGNVGARDYSSLESGNLYLYRYIVNTGQTVQYNYLSRMESGIANSGDTVAIPGYFRNQPKVMVSPAGIGLYKQAYANQDQSLTCAAANISETSSGSAQWTFDATATLNLAANTGTAVVNSSSGAISSNTYNSAHQTTPANCASTTVSIRLLSVRGNGISQYLYRQVSWRIGYRVSGSGSAYSFTTARIKAIGAITSGSVQDSALVSFPSANTWEFYVEYVASDVGTSTFGAISYTYSNETLSGQSGIIAQASADNYPVTVNGSGGNLPASAVNTSWEIYKIDYTLQYDIVFFATNSSGSYDYGTGNAAISIRGTQVAFEEEPFYTYTSNESRYNVVVSHSYTGSNLGRDVNPVTASAYAFGGSQYYGFVTTARIDSLVEKIYRRNPIANSTTPSNEFIFDSHNYSLSSAQVLAYGSLNWLAVGM